ncbi:MAG: hypothetical protein ACKPKO_55000 [Candidatus Fonsibacter sp.]
MRQQEDHSRICKLLVPLICDQQHHVQSIYLGQASTTSSGIEMAASGETTIDFSKPGTNYKGRCNTTARLML